MLVTCLDQDVVSHYSISLEASTLGLASSSRRIRKISHTVATEQFPDLIENFQVGLIKRDRAFLAQFLLLTEAELASGTREVKNGLVVHSIWPSASTAHHLVHATMLNRQRAQSLPSRDFALFIAKRP